MRTEDLKRYREEQAKLRPLRDSAVSEQKEHQTEKDFLQQASLRPTRINNETHQERIVYERNKNGW